MAMPGKAAVAAVSRPPLSSSASAFLGAPTVHRVSAPGVGVGVGIGLVQRREGGARIARSKGSLAVQAAAGGEQKPGGREPWDFGRFLNTVFYFNPLEEIGKSLLQKLPGMGGPSEDSAARRRTAAVKPGSRLVLVTGATGGVGRRIVSMLQEQGVAVRALVRNKEKARRLLGDKVDLVLADVTQPATLQREDFAGVTHVVNCLAVTVGPKEGDTADRAKYYQGIKFFDPEIIGDTPEAVEFRGVLNLLQLLKPALGDAQGCTLVSVGENGIPMGAQWGALDDVVMGGVSASNFQVDLKGGERGQPVGLFQGNVSTANSGGFASVRTRNFTSPQDVSPYSALELRVKADGQRYKLILRTSKDWDTLGYTASFDTSATANWETVRIPFSSFVPVFRARTVPDAEPFQAAASQLYSIQLMLSKFEYDGALNPNFKPGPFQLRVDYIKAVMEEPICPRLVHVGSAGVTRPGRPGLDLMKQPPAVRMNDELGGILTYKLAGEDAIRASGIPYCIVRPCALTEEPAGAPLIFEQGDNITGKIGREEVAQICLAALDTPAALNKTIEVKSTIPFSEPFTVDPANPPPKTDYTPFFKSMKEGITGKEALVS